MKVGRNNRPRAVFESSLNLSIHDSPTGVHINTAMPALRLDSRNRPLG